MAYVNGSHHVTLSVGTAQEDVDFHVNVLGMRFIKRTVLFDGSLPIYHLYYSNANGDPSSVVTTFPFRQAGLKGRPGTNQAREVQLAVPAGSLNFWSQRLRTHAIEATDAEILHQRRVLFRHPCGIEYQLVEVTDDPRVGWTGGGVGAEHAIHGLYGVGIHVANPENMIEFLNDSFYAKGLVEEGDRVVHQVGGHGEGGSIELIVNRRDEPGTWRYGEGTFHHVAWNVETLRNQDELKFAIEGVGYTDISELKDRKYFKSVYVRTPAGALFELAVTHEDGGWTCDESPHELGTRFQLPAQFESRRDELLGQLEPIETPHQG
jgi:glyoxalase family protein